MSIGPVVLSVAGDQFIESARVASIVWVGATTAGDTVSLRGRQATINVLLWKCRTDATHTYLGISFGAHGLPTPDGFRLEQISAGEVLVYLREA